MIEQPVDGAAHPGDDSRRRITAKISGLRDHKPDILRPFTRFLSANNVTVGVHVFIFNEYFVWMRSSALRIEGRLH